MAKGGEAAGPMRKRRTLMADGRYLIYYTFGGEPEAPRAADEVATPATPAPEAEAAAGEQRRV